MNIRRDPPVNLASFWGLGLGEPHAVSGIHGTGIYDLLKEICTDNFTPTDARPEHSVALVT